MRYLLTGIILFVCWSFGAGWWYVCKIKGLCGPSESTSGVVFEGNLPASLEIKSPSGKVIWTSDKLLLFQPGKASPQIPEDFPLLVENLQVWQRNADKGRIYIEGLSHPDEKAPGEDLGKLRAEKVAEMIRHYNSDIDSLFPVSGSGTPDFSIEALTGNAIRFHLGAAPASSRVADATPEDTLKQPAASASAIASAENAPEKDVPDETPPKSPEKSPEKARVEPPVRNSAPAEKITPAKRESGPQSSAQKESSEPSRPIYSPPPDQPVRWSVRFTFDKPEIPNPQNLNRYISEVIDYLGKHPDRKVRIVGHTDNTAEEENSLQLGLERANVIREMFRVRGLEDGRMNVISLGSREPIAPNQTPEGRSLNRRVEISIQ